MPLKASMNTVTIEFEDSLAELLRQTDQPVQQAGREMIVLELYRRGTPTRVTSRRTSVTGSSRPPMRLVMATRARLASTGRASVWIMVRASPWGPDRAAGMS